VKPNTNRVVQSTNGIITISSQKLTRVLQLIPNAIPNERGGFSIISAGGLTQKSNSYGGFDLKSSTKGLLSRSKMTSSKAFTYEASSGADVLFIRVESSGFGIFETNGIRIATCRNFSSEISCS